MAIDATENNTPFSIPSWAGKLFVGAIIAASVSVTISWVTNTSIDAKEQREEQVVIKTNQVNIQDDIREIKENQQRMIDKLDHVIAGRNK